ncbi:MAG: class I SAM-dependent methyltransferase [Simkaniaceae bacterium]
MEIQTFTKSHIHLAHALWLPFLAQGGLFIDATAGNGCDALFIAEKGLHCPLDHLHLFDIQEKALENSRKRCLPYLSQITFHHKSHLQLPDIRAQLIVYNLGYLPNGGDNTLTTETETTLKSVKEGIKRLKKGGALSITCYPGHEEGAREERALCSFFKNQPDLKVSFYKKQNRSLAPSLLFIRHLA